MSMLIKISITLIQLKNLSITLYPLWWRTKIELDSYKGIISADLDMGPFRLSYVY